TTVISVFGFLGMGWLLSLQVNHLQYNLLAVGSSRSIPIAAVSKHLNLIKGRLILFTHVCYNKTGNFTVEGDGDAERSK
ncbi:hypothetical protein V5T82_14270, partial [Magnetovibrio sp. PR-2]|uniref:hypothetical protein n=1 Tax=Magnetovibrio sp. PR-2 TaxID=3120356 RepID=UPI002FCE0AC2